MVNEYERIRTTRDENEVFQTKTECLACGAVNFISDYAEDESVQANKRWFIAQHQECRLFEKAKVKRQRAKGKKQDQAKLQSSNMAENSLLTLEPRYEKAYQAAYTELIKVAQSPVQEESFRNALLKAKEEIQLNSTIHYECGVLTFLSRQSGKRRIVTVLGCHSSCDCRNRISYHWALYEICLKACDE